MTKGSMSGTELLYILYQADDYLHAITQEEERLRQADAQIVRCRCGRPCWQQVCHPDKYCLQCGRYMRLPGQKRDGRRTNVAYGGRGYCMTDYNKVLDAGTEDVFEWELDEAVKSYWANRLPILGVLPDADRS